MPDHRIRRQTGISTLISPEGVPAAGHDMTSVRFAALTMVAGRPEVDRATLAGLMRKAAEAGNPRSSAPRILPADSSERTPAP